MATTDDLLKAKLKELIAKRDALASALEPHRARINAAHVEIQKIKDGFAADVEAIRAATPALKQAEAELAKLASALGGKSLSDAA
jgi:ABC-type transporter Mla subunit MlaD